MIRHTPLGYDRQAVSEHLAHLRRSRLTRLGPMRLQLWRLRAANRLWRQDLGQLSRELNCAEQERGELLTALCQEANCATTAAAPGPSGDAQGRSAEQLRLALRHRRRLYHAILNQIWSVLKPFFLKGGDYDIGGVSAHGITPVPETLPAPSESDARREEGAPSPTGSVGALRTRPPATAPRRIRAVRAGRSEPGAAARP